MKRTEFNIDTACVDVYVNEYAKNPKISIYTPLVEDSLRATPHSYSQLQRLMEDNPLEYAEMALNGTMQEYLDLIDNGHAEQSKTIKEQYRKRYPDMSDTQIDSLVREFMMYDS